jgi:protein O-mannosyl-transferase
MPIRKLSLFLISLAAFAAYVPSLFFKLTYFDDQIILENQNFILKWTNLLVAFQKGTLNDFKSVSGEYYRPLAVISAFWDMYWSGANPFSYHLTNVILHVVVSCLVYLILVRMWNAGNRINLTLALFFAVHPIFVPAVVWIPGRGEIQLALFILLSFYFFLPDRRNLIFHQFFFLCAIFTKETALVFPVVLAFYGFLYRKNLELFRAKALWRYYLGWVICALVFIFAKYNAVGAFASGMGLKDILCSVINNFSGVFLYIGKIFLPVNLSVLPILRDSNLINGKVATLAIGVVLTAILVYSRKVGKNVLRLNFRIIVFGWFWFLAFLFPSFVYPEANSFPGFLEQRVYLPMVGILFMVAEITIFFKSLLSRHKGILSWLTTALILMFAAMTIIRSFDFRDRLVFWKKAVKDAPHSAFARKNLGAMHYLDGNLDLAQEEFNKSLELNSHETIAHNNLGLILMRKGKFTEAEEEYQKELIINPTYDNAYYNYGLLKYKEGKFSQASELWQKTINLNPGYVGAWQALIMLAVESRDLAEAQMYLEKAKRIGLKL